MTEEHPTVAEVFTPHEDPTFTFVTRSDDTSGALIREIAQRKQFVISLSGPSKSGKTVTVGRVFGENLIEITGSNLAFPKDLHLDKPHHCGTACGWRWAKRLGSLQRERTFRLAKQ